jgi:hypothetical protein
LNEPKKGLWGQAAKGSATGDHRKRVTEVDGVPADSAAPAHRYFGGEGAGRYLDDIDQSGATMASVDVRPRWVGVLACRACVPSALGGLA